MNAEIYIIAVKRDHRGLEPADWKEQIGHINGIQVLAGNSSRLRVRASEEAMNRIHADWGHLFHIEKQVVHEPRKFSNL